jgi:arabinofuranan 3-O-arabinosyltransferase
LPDTVVEMGSYSVSAAISHKSSRKLLAIEDFLFTERRIRLYAWSVAAVYIAVLIREVIRGGSVIDATGNPVCIDFCSFWVGGNFATSNDPAAAYDYSAFGAAQAALVGPRHHNFPPFYFAYPPVFLFIVYPLGLMPYLTAFTVWSLLTLVLYMMAVHAVIPRWTTVIASVTPIFVAENAKLGQNGFLTAALIIYSLGCIERRPRLSGLFLALLTYKPQFGLVFPLALLVSRKWTAVFSAVSWNVVLGAAAAIAFSYKTWPLYVDAVFNRNWDLSADRGVRLTQQSVFGLLHWAGASATISWSLHLTIAAAIAILVCVVWAKPLPSALKSAALCVGTVSVTPYVQIYDLTILSVAVVFLVKDCLSRGFLPGERTAMLICFAGSFFLLAPVGPVIELVVLLLITRRIVAHGRLDAAAAPAHDNLIETQPIAVD